MRVDAFGRVAVRGASSSAALDDFCLLVDGIGVDCPEVGDLPVVALGVALATVFCFDADAAPCVVLGAGRPLVRGVVCDTASGETEQVSADKNTKANQTRYRAIPDAPLVLQRRLQNPFAAQRLTKNAAAL
jgi:hypothetical protein